MQHRRPARKFILGGSLATLTTPAWSGLFVRPASADDTYTLRLSISTPVGSTFHALATEFSTAVERRANGRLKVEVYPSGQLMKEYESTAGLITGTLDFSVHDASYLTSVFAPASVLLLPFMFKDVATLYKVVDGPIGADLAAQLDAKGIMCLSWGAGSFRTMDTTTKAITKIDDMKGLRFRIHGGADVPMMQALSAIPVNIDSSEVYTSLSQHAIDGTEVAVEAISSQKLYALIKHIAFSNHVVSLAPILASKKRIEALPADLQRIIKEQALAVRTAQRNLVVRRSQEAVDICKANGVAFTDIDYPPFRKAMDPVYASLAPKLGADLIQKVSRAAVPAS